MNTVVLYELPDLRRFVTGTENRLKQLLSQSASHLGTWPGSLV